MKLKDILPPHPLNNIEVRTNDPDGDDMLFGFCHWTGTKLISGDGDNYYLNEEISEYKFDGEHLTYWIVSNGYKLRILNGGNMKLKQIFCKHNWLWVGCRHVGDSKGAYLKTYYQIRCEKCGRQYETISDEFKLKGKIKKRFEIKTNF